MVKYHLVVLVHGIWGNPSHMTYLANEMKELDAPLANEKMEIYVTGSHSGYLTYDGIDVNGKRISDEIEEKANSLREDSHTIAKFSLIGYSMGGLVARYALGVLFNQNFFENIEPYHFATFCTPHVGTLNPSGSLSSRIFNGVAPHILAQTGKHMFLKDSDVSKGSSHLPLLMWMSDPASKFYKALAAFKHRTLYANTINDRRTSWYTTSISRTDPFRSMVSESSSAYDLEYVEGYKPTVINFEKSIEFQRVDRSSPKFNWRRYVFKAFLWSKLIVRSSVLFPFFALYSVVKAVWERAKVNKRLKDFSKDGASSLVALYDAMGDNMIARSTSLPDDRDKEDSSFTETNSDLPNISLTSNLNEQIADQTELFVDSIFKALNSTSYFDYHHSITNMTPGFTDDKETSDLQSVVDLDGNQKSNFHLSLTPVQESIVASLNKLRWNKFPVIIRATKATHAAVIYRHPDPHFAEGKLVVRHFVDNFFNF